MNIREVAGLILLIVSLILFPFGYWLHRAWYIVALVLACIGAFMFFTRRISDKASPTHADTDHLNAPIIPSDLRGFPGGRIRETHKTDVDIDGDEE
jgi:uncharacterized membrane protein YfcA